MLKINIISIGKIKEKYISDGIKEYQKRIEKYVNLKIIELNEEEDNVTAIQKESTRIIEEITNKRAYNILLDIKSNNLSSEQLASKIDKLTMSYSTINFIIGGSRGANDEVRKKCDYLLSFSNMTFPHQLFRLMLVEQIYRSICIINNIKYHK
ncbi:23S rRNA (pseudouridine(1915)-N(3))-methyltransferase RlmH [Caviibacter abscessus]|uniref:23S rRNA (pseudouridine(1915)-N(3))-methyltransferase RlmH n=1 Tax=Caviibacter abscessus TaxID=1766719 RepID=UPI00082BD3B3|nr:23S rRNA (pseudouridine(1915)-N(3))-methyltransferase RlmH [Caviibacter abscessus]